jgi:hypothetical protein
MFSHHVTLTVRLIYNSLYWHVLPTLLNVLHLISSNLHNNVSIQDKLNMKTMHAMVNLQFHIYV